MQEGSILKLNLDVTMHVQSHELHHSGQWGCWYVAASFFRKFGGRYAGILKLLVKYIYCSGVQFNIDIIIKKPFSSRIYDKKL